MDSVVKEPMVEQKECIEEKHGIQDAVDEVLDGANVDTFEEIIKSLQTYHT